MISHAVITRKVIHRLDGYLTRSVRWIRLKRAAEADSSLRRFRLLPLLCLILGFSLITTTTQANTNKADHYKLYAHSRILNDVQYKCFTRIIYKESRWNHLAKNGSHFGLGQMRSQHYRNLDPYRQIDQTLKYIAHRYGSSCNAWRFHQKNNYF